MSDMVKVVHMKKRFPHGWFAACGRPITAHSTVVSSWSEVTCKNCKLKEMGQEESLEYSDLTRGIPVESC
jgi:hypothetical protein